MTADSSSSQISSLLESLPGIANVLRSPVADALVRTIRAAAGLEAYSLDDAVELVRYAVRRGLIGSDEGDRVIAEIEEAAKKRRSRPSARGSKARKPVKKAAKRR